MFRMFRDDDSINLVNDHTTSIKVIRSRDNESKTLLYVDSRKSQALLVLPGSFDRTRCSHTTRPRLPLPPSPTSEENETEKGRKSGQLMTSSSNPDEEKTLSYPKSSFQYYYRRPIPR